MRNLKLVIGLFIFITACEEPVKFAEPQPKDKSNLSSFPNRLLGTYKSVDDDYVLEISDNMIVRKFKANVSLTKTELDSSKNLKLNGNILFDSDNNLSFKVSIQNDSITGFAIQSDSIFNITSDNVLRKYNGHYFLNTKVDNGYTVYMLTNEGAGKITISAIEKDEIANLKAVTAAEEPADSLLSNYQFQISKKEFKKFVNEMHGFRSIEVFQKVKVN